MKRAAAILAVCVGAAWSSAAMATSITRSSSFAYDAGSGLITQQVIEPNTPSLRSETDTTYDAFGNKFSATTSGIDIATRGSSTAYDARGQFITGNTNALSQSETFQFDARFGKPTSQTGPNGLTTTWSYDTFGRKILEVRADGTRTAYSYQFCNGVNGGTAGCAGATPSYLISATPLASDGVTQNGAISVVYFDSLDREIGRDTQGFNGSTVRARRLYDSLGHVQETTRPFFLGGAWQITTYTYDALDRVLTTTLPDGSTKQEAYHGLTVTQTNALNQTRTVTKNARGDVVSVTDALGQTMTYAYDPLGDLLSTTDAVGNVVSATYDLRGRKIFSSDPDLGSWSYSYDTLSELVSQTDAKGQTTTLSYDKLGRPVQRLEPDMTSVWVYDTAAMGVGKLTSTSIAAGPGAGYQRAISYDSLGRPSQTTTTISGTAYTFSAAYDGNGRLSSVTYPSGFIAKYSYNSLGYSDQLADGTTSQVHWTLNALDAEQHITQETSGNGIVTTQSFDPETGRLLAANAGYQNAVQNFSYSYDTLGNLLSRVDGNENLSESFTYDALNRVTSAAISSNIAPVKTFSYDAVGDLTTKSDVGTYTYPTPGSPQPHAVTSVTGGTITTSFTYDADGNQTSGLGRSITWSSYNKPAGITQGTQTISFLDDPGHQRFQQVTPQGTTLYFDSFGVHAEFAAASGSGTWNEFLTVGNVMVGVRFLNLANETVTVRYFHTDHLGSISVITDQTGVVVERLSYDAWGKRRYPNGADDPAGAITSETTRGFTSQEELSVTGLVHLNGRVYDTLMARMMSADPTVPDALNPQAWNRYSYVGNDPLTFTDPTGYSWLSSFFNDVGVFFRSILANSLVRAIVQIAIAAVISSLFPPGLALLGSIVAAAASAAIITGLSGGNLGAMLRAAAIAGATAFAFYEVGDITFHTPTFGTPNYFANVAGHAAVGCLSAVASGGKCGPGALAAGAGSAAAPLVTEAFPGAGGDLGQRLEGSAVTGIVGGLASVAGGGKFADGAVTAAFGYLFNSTSGGLRGVTCDAQCVAQGEALEQNVAIGLAGIALLPLFVVADTVEFGLLSIEEAGTIGDLFLGAHPDTMIHLTPFSEADFSAGISEGTSFARLGDVADMTVQTYRTDVVGPAAPGSIPSANLFIWVGPESMSAFEPSGVWNLSGTAEYTNKWLLDMGGAVHVPHG
jgi:RHS repeat-associated protein